MSKYRDFLKKVSLFKKLEEKALNVLGDTLSQKMYPKNSVIFEQGDPGEAMYLILYGRVKVVLYSESGREVILSYLKDDDFFGEMAIVAKQSRSATVITLEDTSLLRLSREDFAAQVHKCPDIALGLLEVLAARLKEADEKIGDLALIDVYGRVARYLLRLGQEQGKPMEGGVLVEARPTHQEIANVVGTARETVSRAISEFIKSGKIRIEGKTLFIPKGTSLSKEYL